MELYTYHFTDFTSWHSPSMEMWLAHYELSQFGATVAQEMVAANPDLLHKGLCIAIYDREGNAVSLAPLDTVH